MNMSEELVAKMEVPHVRNMEKFNPMKDSGEPREIWQQVLHYKDL